MLVFFFFKQKTAYEMRISDWSSDVCSSDLLLGGQRSPVLRHVEKDVKHARKSAVAFHVTLISARSEGVNPHLIAARGGDSAAIVMTTDRSLRFKAYWRSFI